MSRELGTNEFGLPFSEEVIKKVWKRARPVDGEDEDKIRKDVCGAWIYWNEYGRATPKGWVIDHIIPVASKKLDSFDNLANLQALHWQNNEAKGDSYPASNFCLIVST